MNKKYLIQFAYSHRYLKSFTKNGKGEVDDIETTMHRDRAMHLDLHEAMEYKTNLFNILKSEIVEEGTFKLYLPTQEEYRMMYERRLEHSSNEELADEILSRIDSSFTVAEIRARLSFCFGHHDVVIHYTNGEKEVDVEDVFKYLKNGGKTFVNGHTQYKWQCYEHVEIIELGKRPYSGYWIQERRVVDFRYETPLEMLKDKNIRFPITGYKEGFICEKVFFGNTHDIMEKKDGKTIITPFKNSSFITIV